MKVPDNLVHARGHEFGADLVCKNCRKQSWRMHQTQRTKCPFGNLKETKTRGSK